MCVAHVVPEDADDHLIVQVDEQIALHKAYAASLRREAALMEDLLKYGRHLSTCAKYGDDPLKPQWKPDMLCTCGFAQALRPWERRPP